MKKKFLVSFLFMLFFGFSFFSLFAEEEYTSTALIMKQNCQNHVPCPYQWKLHDSIEVAKTMAIAQFAVLHHFKIEKDISIVDRRMNKRLIVLKGEADQIYLLEAPVIQRIKGEVIAKVKVSQGKWESKHYQLCDSGWAPITKEQDEYQAKSAAGIELKAKFVDLYHSLSISGERGS